LIGALPLITVPYSLTIAGNGDENYIASLKTISQKNSTSSNINWVGFHGDDKFELLHDHDIFVLPSYDENFGNAVIESLSVGTPVLISEHVGLADYVVKNKLGWLCQTNPESLGEKINDIAKNQVHQLNTIRQEAPGLIENDFNGDNLVKKYIDLYNQLIEG
jgi:glycosyltransferase involved in cell wall biosynthesis